MRHRRLFVLAALIALTVGLVVYGVWRSRDSSEASFGIHPIVHTAHSADLGYRARPNIFLILIDTLRPDHLGAYGYSRRTSPALDQLVAEDGIVFKRAYSVAPWTNPAIATLFTGQYPQTVFAPAPHHIAITQALPNNIETMAEVVKQSGYRTVALVDHPGINERLGYSRGFDEFHVLYAEGGADHWKRTDPRYVLEAFQSATANAGSAGEPIFVYLHLVYPHRPYIPANRYKRFFGDGFTRNEESQKDGMINMYDAEIFQTDELLGRMFQDMKSRGWFEDTAIVFTSDHGEGFWEHGLAEHGTSFFDEEIRIPLIIVPPGGRTTEPMEIERPVSSVSLFATVLDFAGITPRRGVHGASLLRFFHPGASPETESAPEWFFSESPHSMDIHARAALSSEGEKYILYQKPEGFPHELLFDLTADPLEQQNLAGDARHLSEYRSLLRDLSEMSRAARAASSQETVDVDPDTLKRLRALGYLQ